MRPKSKVLFREKSSKSLKKKISGKEILPAYLCIYDLQNGVRNFFSE